MVDDVQSWLVAKRLIPVFGFDRALGQALFFDNWVDRFLAGSTAFLLEALWLGNYCGGSRHVIER